MVTMVSSGQQLTPPGRRQLWSAASRACRTPAPGLAPLMQALDWGPTLADLPSPHLEPLPFAPLLSIL